MSYIERYSISGTPSDSEERAIIAAIEAALTQEREQLKPSRWKFAGRAAALGIGVSELRHRLGGRGIELSDQLPWQQPAPNNLHGRGDAK